MRAHELVDNRKTNPAAHDIRKRYHKMYYHFKPAKVYWIMVIIMRKLGIAVAGLMLRQNPGFQLSVCLALLFICYVLQVKHRPYMSTSERINVQIQHRAKVDEHDELKKKNRATTADLRLHKRIDTHMKLALIRMEEERARLNPGDRFNTSGPSSFGGSRSALRQKTRMMTTESRRADSEGDVSDESDTDEDAAVEASQAKDRTMYFDYNTVEATLLGSAIVVCLGGIMFENERFKVRDDLGYQKDIITYTVLFVIALSLLYYCIVFISEVFAWHPAWILRIFAGRKARKEQESRKHMNRHGPSIDTNNLDEQLNVNPLHLTSRAASQQEEKSNRWGGRSDDCGSIDESCMTPKQVNG